MVKVIEEINPFTKIVRSIEAKEEQLSFSSFKEFCKSPRHFMAYKLRQKESTPAMAFGSAVHCMILEPDEFEKRYTVKDKPDLRKKENKLAWAAVLEYAENNHLEVITSADHETAKRMADFAYQDESIRWVLDQVHTTELGVKWEYSGYKWRGFIDGVGDDLFMDLKLINPLDPNKFRWRFKNDRIIWQAALYQMSKEAKGKDFYMVCLENAPNGMVIKFEAKTLAAFVEEIDYYVAKFKQCVFQDAWNEGYNFWAGRDKIYNWNDI
jgi:exodeoxyribonuclease VIII